MNTLSSYIEKLMNILELNDLPELTKKNQVSFNRLAIPTDDLEIFQNLNLKKYDAVIAGGACLKWYQGFPVKNHDIDLWFKSEEGRVKFIDYLLDINTYNHDGYIDTENAVTMVLYNTIVKYRIQTIKTPYNTISDLLATFDFSVCKIATDGQSWFLGENYARDLKNKKLIVEKCSEMTPKRLIKYWSYGFEPDSKTLETIRNFPNVKWSYTSREQDGDY